MREKVKRAEALANLLDSQFSLKGFSFGIDPIFGLVPVVGDLIPTLVSLYIVLLAFELKLPRWIIGKMLLYLFVDYLVSQIPLIGDIFDFTFKSNNKNVALIKKHVNYSEKA